MPVATANSVVAESPSTVAVPNISKAVAEPVTRASRQIYETIAGGVEWYFEQWEDLVVEAKASLTSGDEGLSVAGMLAGLAEATVVSDIPGRVRLRLKQLKGHGRLADQSAQSIGSIEGVKHVEVSARTGSILILYDTARYPSRETLVLAVATHE